MSVFTNIQFNGLNIVQFNKKRLAKKRQAFKYQFVVSFS